MNPRNLLILLSLLCGLSFAGEPAKPVKKEIEPVEVKLSLRTPQGRGTAAMLRILDTHSRPVLAEKGLDWLWVEDPVKLSLKPGSYSLIFKKGPRTQPVSRIIDLTAKGLQAKIELKHYAPVRAAGWQLADPYVQSAGITTDGFRYNTLDKLSLAGRSNGMDFIAADGLWQLASADGQKFALRGNAIHSLLADLKMQSTKGCTIAASTSVQRPGLGRFYTLEAIAPISAHRQVGGNLLYPSLSAVRERGGLCIISHPSGLAGGAQIARELVFDTLAGPMFDLIDISRGERDIAIWQTLLNLGYRIPAVCGGPQNLGDEDYFPEAGCYVKIARQSPGARGFIDAIAKGNSIASNGPFLRFFVENPSEEKNLSAKEQLARSSTIGGTTYISSKPRSIWLDAYTCSDPRDTIKRIDLIYNGRIIESAKGLPGQKTMQLRWNRIVLNRTGWLQVRYYSQARDLFAISNPIYIESPDFVRPLPVCSRLTLNLRAQDNTPITSATITASNLGVIIGKWKYHGKPLTISLPATAQITASAPGYANSSTNLYSASGAHNYIDTLYKNGSLSKALAKEDTYRKTRAMLKKISYTLTLLKAPTM